MLNPLPISQAQQKRQKRDLLDQAKDAEVHSVKRLFRIEASKLALDSHDKLVDPIIISGEALSTFRYSKNQVFVRNITLNDADTEETFLQRFQPPHVHIAERMTKDARRGMRYFDKLAEVANCGELSAAARQLTADKGNPHFHFGVWYDLSKRFLVISSETRQATNEAGRRAVADFCAWFKLFASAYLKPLVDDQDSGLCCKFRKELNERTETHFPWASKRIEGLASLCLPLYSTFSPFRGFSGRSHRDHQDANVSMLINLGQHAVMELREYNCHIILQPLDIVFLHTNSVHHRTLQHPAHIAARSNPQDRFAIACFFRQDLKDRRLPNEPHVVLLTQNAQEEQELQRREGTKRKGRSDEAQIQQSRPRRSARHSAKID